MPKRKLTLVETLATKAGVPERIVKKVLTALPDAVLEELAEKEITFLPSLVQFRIETKKDKKTLKVIPTRTFKAKIAKNLTAIEENDYLKG